MVFSHANIFHNSCCCSSSIASKRGDPAPATPSLTSLSLPIPYRTSRIQNRRHLSLTRTHAKFDKFEGEASPEALLDNTQQQQTEIEDAVDEDDSCLPSDLVGAVRQSGQASALFVSSGGMRAIVELLIPQLQFLDDEGAQGELWELSRIFLDTLIAETGSERVKAIFPDAGAAALLQHRWKDAAFGISSLSDRKPVGIEDEIVVMVVPDYQMLEYVERIASNLSDDPARPLIMWNPRLVSEGVGVGFNVRKLRRFFLRTFAVVYSMRPLPAGAVFRCYPGLWKVFYDDKERPNRYLLAKELLSRPDADELEMIFGNLEEKSGDGSSLLGRAASIFYSLSRFMKKSIESSGNISHKGSSDKHNQHHHRVHRRWAPAAEQPEPNLDHIHHRKHQEEAPHHAAHGGTQHPGSQDPSIDMGTEGLIRIVAVEYVDGQLQPLGYEGGEEEEAEGDDLEGEQPFSDADAGRTERVEVEGLLSRGCEGEADEDCDREERVDVYEAIECCDVDAGGSWCGHDDGGGGSVIGLGIWIADGSAK
ncbi:hypothetical protein Dimus_016937 [Dionaea muscipula]